MRDETASSGQGLASLDLVLARIWDVTSFQELELRLEAFNVLNRASIDLPNRIFGTPNFGRIFSSKSPREMQFDIKLSF